jgi:hypothetical protein
VVENYISKKPYENLVCLLNMFLISSQKDFEAVLWSCTMEELNNSRLRPMFHSNILVNSKQSFWVHNTIVDSTWNEKDQFLLQSFYSNTLFLSNRTCGVGCYHRLTRRKWIIDIYKVSFAYVAHFEAVVCEQFYDQIWRRNCNCQTIAVNVFINYCLIIHNRIIRLMLLSWRKF